MSRDRIRRLRPAGLLVAIGLATAVPVSGVAQDGRSGLVAGGDSPGLFLLYTGDVIGYIDPCG